MRSHSTPLPESSSIPDTTQRLIKRLKTSATNVVNARNDDARVAARGFMISRALELCERRDELLQKIEEGWAWLEGFEDGDPEVATQEDRFSAWNVELRAITDALDDAAETWTGRKMIGEQDIWAA